MLNLVWLKTFKTLVELSHFTRTAEALFMTQPGVTQHIQKLEHACKTQLLHKKGKSFELTEQGYQVYEFACESLEKQDALLADLQQDDPTKGSIKLACSGALAQWFFPQFIAVQKQLPGLQILFEAAPNNRICENVIHGHSLFGLVTQIPNRAEFDVKSIGSEPLCLVLPKSYKNKAINEQKLFDLGLVDHPDAEQYLAKYLTECGEKTVETISIRNIHKISYINQLSQILYPISQGVGFTVLPMSAVLSSPVYNELSIHQPKTAVKDELFLISKRERPLPNRYHQFIEIIEQALRNTDPL
jgi:DNA-binding transcriptional LysR family regulator